MALKDPGTPELAATEFLRTGEAAWTCHSGRRASMGARFDYVALWTLYLQQFTLAINADHVREDENAFGFLRKLISLGHTDFGPTS
jgi:hypothetical protein